MKTVNVNFLEVLALVAASFLFGYIAAHMNPELDPPPNLCTDGNYTVAVENYPCPPEFWPI